MAIVTERTAIEDLRLGHTILQRIDSRWYGEHISYLEENWDERGQRNLRFETQTLPDVLDRIINPDDYLFKGLPLSSEDVDLPDEPRQPTLRRIKKAALVIPAAIRGRTSYLTSKNHRLLKQVQARDLEDVSLDSRVLRYAVQTLHPGACVSIKQQGVHRTDGRIKAVGFGIAGASLAILLHNPWQADAKAKRVLEGDFWLNAEDIQISVHDKRSPGRTLLKFDRLRSFEAFPHV